MMTPKQVGNLEKEVKSIKQNQFQKFYSLEVLGWSKSSFRFFHNILWKNPNKLFGQPNTITEMKTLYRLSGRFEMADQKT